MGHKSGLAGDETGWFEDFAAKGRSPGRRRAAFRIHFAAFSRIFMWIP
jgi:hypothetical protein